MECEARHSVRFWREKKSSLCIWWGTVEPCVGTAIWWKMEKTGFKWQQRKNRLTNNKQSKTTGYQCCKILVHTTSKIHWFQLRYISERYMKLDKTFYTAYIKKKLAYYITSLTKPFVIRCLRCVVNVITLIESVCLTLPTRCPLLSNTLWFSSHCSLYHNPVTLTW